MILPTSWNTDWICVLLLRNLRGFILPLRTNELVESQPVKAWNPSKELIRSAFMDWWRKFMSIHRLLSPTPVSNFTSPRLVNCGKKCRSKRNTSVSVDLTITLSAPDVSFTYLRWRINLVSASSCEEKISKMGLASVDSPSSLPNKVHSSSQTK